MQICQIHRVSIFGAAYLRDFGSLALVAVFDREIPRGARITDETAEMRARVCKRVSDERTGAFFKLNGLHRNVVLIAKGV